mmetsp:Transcript_36358/g.88812  ORF Transcript_36358/g.88812 Transcript_36358/m.88812 type:complete len:297 (+) Transcript_36358:1217-2107(+)
MPQASTLIQLTATVAYCLPFPASALMMGVARALQRLAGQGPVRRSRWPWSVQRRCFRRAPPQQLASDPQSTASVPEAPRTSSWLRRMLDPAPPGGKQNPILRAMGYYSKESRIVHAGSTLYAGCLKQSNWSETSPPPALGLSSLTNEEWQVFGTRLQVLSIHVWMTLVRLRDMTQDGPQVAEQLFFSFWEDLPKKMVEEEGLGYMEMRKWVKVCEKNFFGMGTSFDAALAADDDRDGKLKVAIERNVPLTRNNPTRVNQVFVYIERELDRLDSITEEALWAGSVWSEGEAGRNRVD